MSSRSADEPTDPPRRRRRIVFRVKTPTQRKRRELLRLSRNWPDRKVRVGPGYTSISILVNEERTSLVNEERTSLKRIRLRVRKALAAKDFKRLRPGPLGRLLPLPAPGARRRGHPKKKSVADAPEASPTEPMSSYTPKQRETFLKGLGILARVAIRAHMERQAPGSGTAPDDGGGEEEG